MSKEEMEVARPSVEYHATVWGDYFLKYASNDSTKSKNITEMELKIHGDFKEEVKKKMITITNLSEKINFIDAIERLGIGYQFESEIEDAIHRIYDISSHDGHLCNDNLHTCAVRFRLLRQHGYNISGEIFKKFMDKKGEFNATIRNDIKGMLSLHEAGHLRLRGEEILEKAQNFTTSELEAILHDNLINESNLMQQITYVLDQSLHKGFIRIEAYNYFKFYQNDESHDERLLEFAKLDFNILQNMHQTEIVELTRWWKHSEMTKKFPFTRDRLVESYLWASSIYFEPQYIFGRNIFTKLVLLLTIMDDIYDAYANWDELVLITDMINRWSENDFTRLPDYMRYLYEVFEEYYDWLEKESAQRGLFYGVQHLKKMVKVLANAYFEEARWAQEGYTPTIEEYMNCAGLITSGCRILTIISFIGMDPILATKEAFDWVINNPPIIKAAGFIMRLSDDIVGFKFEQQRKHVASAVQCYVREHDVLEEIAIHELRKEVIDEWKDINYELIHETQIPLALLSRVVNLARIVNVLYKEEDGFTHSNSKIKDTIASLFVNHVG
ncbi:sesquiterpene synthase 2-like [Impatiens glandulifera]|uniref:sesquiterpene synthase 2-like n=1 Tax=Impatiens glandulifera TaxID=253017 RepID=UPI001FB0D2F3|nr:sesquiterpene synthase 2-like [Impatiens glandulifera]